MRAFPDGQFNATKNALLFLLSRAIVKHNLTLPKQRVMLCFTDFQMIFSHLLHFLS